MTRQPTIVPRARTYRAGRLSTAEAGRLASEILAGLDHEDDRQLCIYLTRRLRDIPSAGGTAEDIWSVICLSIALQLTLGGYDDPDEALMVNRLLHLTAYSKRDANDERTLEEFDFAASSWWQSMVTQLQAIGDGLWADETDD
jgi:hypothetical protein